MEQTLAKSDYSYLEKFSEFFGSETNAVKLVRNGIATKEAMGTITDLANVAAYSDVLRDGFYGIKNSRDTTPRNYQKAIAMFSSCMIRALLWSGGDFLLAYNLVMRGMSTISGGFMIEGKLQASIAKIAENIDFEHNITILSGQRPHYTFREWDDVEKKSKTKSEPMPIDDMELTIWAAKDGKAILGSDGRRKETIIKMSQVYKKDTWEAADIKESRLIYRGYREWINQHAPHLLDGVYTREEIEDSSIEKDVTPSTQQNTTPAISILSKIALPKEVQQPIKPQDIVIDQPKKQDVVQNKQVNDVFVFIRDGVPFSIKRTNHGLANLFMALQKSKENVTQFLEENTKEDVERIEELIHTLPESESVELMRQYTEIFAEKVQAKMRGSENETQ